MAENNAPSQAKGLAAYGYTPRTAADMPTAKGKGLEDLGYDRTGYIGKMDPAMFTAPLSEVAKQPTTSNLNATVAKYAEERLNARNTQLEAQLSKAYEGMDQIQKNLYDDLYSFYGGTDTSREAFYRQMFDLSGRMSNNAVSKALVGKMADYTTEANFNTDAKRTGYFTEGDKNAGLLFGWGSGKEGSSDLYSGSKTFKYREDQRKNSANLQAFNYNRAYLDSLNSDGGAFDKGFKDTISGRVSSSFREAATNPAEGNYQKAYTDLQPGESYEVVHMGATPEETIVIGSVPITQASKAKAAREEAARQAAAYRGFTSNRQFRGDPLGASLARDRARWGRAGYGSRGDGGRGGTSGGSTDSTGGGGFGGGSGSGYA